MGSFKRKVYGKVRPTPKKKEVAPAKPAVNELKSIFNQIKKTSEWQVLDLLSEAICWWHKAIPYCAWQFKKKGMPLTASKAFLEGWNMAALAQMTKENKLKQARFIIVLDRYRRYAAPLFKVPDLAPYLKASKDFTKKTKGVDKKVNEKFDSVLSLLTKCFDLGDTGVDLVASSTLLEDRKFDHELGNMYYSRAMCQIMKQKIHREGLLVVAIEEAWHISRGLSLMAAVGSGSFVYNADVHNKQFKMLLNRFEKFAHTPEAPKTLVRKVKKPRPVGPKKVMPWLTRDKKKVEKPIVRLRRLVKAKSKE